MRKRFGHLPSPAMALAFIALFAALGGTAIALPGRNVVKRDDIARGAVNSSDIANNTIRTQDIRRNGVTGSDVAANTLGGGDINEGSLGTVPNANTAGTANSAATAGTANAASSANTANSVGGVQLRRFRYMVNGASSARQILNFSGLVLSASCSGAALGFAATTTVNNTQFGNFSVDPGDSQPAMNKNEITSADLDVGEGLDLVTDNDDAEVGQIRYSRPDGGGVHVQWHTHTAGGAGCAVNGVASAF